MKAEVKMLTMAKSLQEVLFTKTTNITVNPYLYFKPTFPIPETEVPLYNLFLPWKMNPLKIEGRLYRNQAPQRFEENFEGNKETAILCQIQAEGGNVVHKPALVNLSPSPKDTQFFSGTFEGIGRPGKYKLISVVKSRLKSGGPYAFQTQYDFSIGRGSFFNPFTKAPNWYAIFGYIILLIYIALAIRLLVAISLRPFRGRLRGRLVIEGQTVPLSNTLIFNKLMLRKVKGFHIPRFCQRKVNSPKCPTFWVIGGKGEKNRATRRREGAVWIFNYLQFPFWQKLTPRSPSTNVQGVTVRWMP